MRAQDPSLDGRLARACARSQGLRDAGEVLERALQAVPGGSHAPRAAGGLIAAAEAWTDVLRRALEGSTTAAAEPALQDAGAGRLMRLSFPGPRPADAVWLHNGGGSDVGPLTFLCGPLTDAGGVTLDGLKVCFDPVELTCVRARESRAVAVRLTGAPALRAGVYRSAIRTEGALGLWLSLEVAVLPC
jgi:hypothetical protein